MKKKILLIALACAVFGRASCMEDTEQKAASWKGQCLSNILQLINISDKELSPMVARAVDQERRADKARWFGKDKKWSGEEGSVAEVQKVYDAKKEEIIKLRDSAKDLNDLTDAKLKMVNSALAKIELLSLPAYAYKNVEKDRKIGEVAQFVFLSPGQAKELRLRVVEDLKKEENYSESKAFDLVCKHLKSIDAEKLSYLKKAQDDYKNLYKFRLALIKNNDLYKANSIFFEKYLEFVAGYESLMREVEPKQESSVAKYFNDHALNAARTSLDEKRKALEAVRESDDEEKITTAEKAFNAQSQAVIDLEKQATGKSNAGQPSDLRDKLSGDKVQKLQYLRNLAGKLQATAQQKIAESSKVMSDFYPRLIKTALAGIETLVAGGPFVAVNYIALGVLFKIPSMIPNRLSIIKTIVKLYNDWKGDLDHYQGASRLEELERASHLKELKKFENALHSFDVTKFDFRSLIYFAGLPALFMAQNYLIDLFVKNKNMKQAQEFYAFFEIQNNVANMMATLRRVEAVSGAK
ncbi:MAG: hypothetical protein US49_C0001G0076 [candidate division TM6 bacterium GW2011_GWF2_37_49]|nr:MAG: hypothetical protein US49_C0001G0076 [candidate division TM6 bacterium GW2011_GWF2_37_49]